MRQFLIVIERASKSYAAYSPDLPGCVATSKIRVETRRNMQAAIKLHIKGLKEDKLSVPKPTSSAEYIVA